jgi:hypothetical protein
MLVGVTFFCTAYVQYYRGHIGIEALAGLLPRRVNAVRHVPGRSGVGPVLRLLLVEILAAVP